MKKKGQRDAVFNAVGPTAWKKSLSADFCACSCLCMFAWTQLVLRQNGAAQETEHISEAAHITQAPVAERCM